MDINHQDTTVDGNQRIMYQLRLSFADGTVLSPTDIFNQVKKMIKDNNKEVRNSVGRLGDLLVGTYHQGGSLFFAMGWYFRKAIETLETGDGKTKGKDGKLNKVGKGYGKCKIQYESEEVTKEMFAQHFAQFISREADKMKELANEIIKGHLPEELFDDEEPTG